MRADLVQRDEANVKGLDLGEINPWKWEWLEFKAHGCYIGDNIRKLQSSGKAYCTLCEQEIKYGKKGRPALTQHLKSKKHQDAVKTVKENYSLPGTSVMTLN
jgi:hypothetical protein